MMARRIIPVLLIALLVSGLFTLWLSKRFSKTAVAAPVATTRFVAVTKNMEAGEQLQPAMLQMVDWPASHPLRGAFMKPEELMGRILLSPIAAGEVVLDHNLAAPGTVNGLTARIPPGMRAIALRSDEVAGVAGFLLPGTYVDVLVTYRPTVAAGTIAAPAIGGETELITATVLQSARVLAAGQKMEADPDGKANAASVVTLLVTPQDAEKLTLASSLGKILFVLRNGADRKEVADLAPQMSLPGGMPRNEAKPAPAIIKFKTKPVVAAVPRYTVQTLSGNKMTEETFEGKAK